MDQIKPEHLITKDECQKMIDCSIDRNNKTAIIISASVVFILLLLYVQWSP